MSEQPLTYKGVLEMFQEGREQSEKEWRELREQFRETEQLIKSIARQQKETDRQMKERDIKYAREKRARDAEYERMRKDLNNKIGKLGNRIGDIIENMVGGNALIRKFKKLDYKIERHSRNVCFGHGLPKEMQGEVDLLLEDGNIAILVEVKTTLRTADARAHIERLEKYRRVADIKGDQRCFIGAVAGAVVEGDAQEFAHKNGMYVIVQSGEAVEIVQTPEGFKAKEW